MKGGPDLHRGWLTTYINWIMDKPYNHWLVNFNELPINLLQDSDGESSSGRNRTEQGPYRSDLPCGRVFNYSYMTVADPGGGVTGVRPPLNFDRDNVCIWIFVSEYFKIKLIIARERIRISGHCTPAVREGRASCSVYALREHKIFCPPPPPPLYLNMLDLRLYDLDDG